MIVNRLLYLEWLLERILQDFEVERMRNHPDLGLLNLNVVLDDDTYENTRIRELAILVVRIYREMNDIRHAESSA